MCEIEDFELEPAEYKVIATGYDLEGEEIEGSLVIATNPDPEEAIRVARLKASYYRSLVESGSRTWGGEDASIIMLRVETVIKVDGEKQYAGSIWTEGVLVESGANA